MTISGLKLLKSVTSSSALVCIYLGGFDVRVADCFYNGVTFGFGATRNHDFCEHIRILSHFMRNNGTTPPAPIIRTLPISSTYKSFKYDYHFFRRANIRLNSQINIKILLNTLGKVLLFLNNRFAFELFFYIFVP